MEWTFAKIQSPEYIRIVTTGSYSADNFLQLLTDLFALPYWKLGSSVLWDNRNIDLSIVLPTELLRSAGNFVRFNSEIAFTRIAVLYTSEQSMGIAERYGRISDDRSTARLSRFLDEKLALDWLCPRNTAAAEG